MDLNVSTSSAKSYSNFMTFHLVLKSENHYIFIARVSIISSRKAGYLVFENHVDIVIFNQN